MAESKANFSSAENGIYYFEEINRVLNTNTNIEEFDIIPSIKPEGKSCPFVLDENRLGIFSWCVKDLFCYVYGELMVARKYKCVATEDDEGVHLMDLSRVILLLHSEDYTIWNLRKCYITSQIEKYAKAELDVCALVLRKHPRSAETFSHRRWLINMLQKKKEQFLETPQFLQDELDLTLLCAERYHDNYITWDQRCWLVDYFMFDKITWLEEELNSIKDWLWSHVSDNCVYHFRQHLLKKLAVSCSLTKAKELLLEEFKFTDELLKHYPVFETVWYHRRFVMSFWSTKFPPCRSCLIIWQNKDDQKEQTIDRSKLLKDLKKEDEIMSECCESCRNLDKGEIISISHEMEFCQRTIVETNDKCLELFRQSDLAKSHLKWIQYFCKKLSKRT